MKYTVIGARGLLGSAVVRTLRARGASPFTPAIAWESRGYRASVRDALKHASAESASEPWQLLWCAGVGVISTGPMGMRKESDAFQVATDLVAELPSEVQARGSLVLASSAGALYAGSEGAPFDETSSVSTLGDYGRAKLREESALRALSDMTGIPTLAARISNLYGPGQSVHKGQGLITQLCLATLTRQPLTIFVSLDTQRDYIYVDDCAHVMLCAGRELVDGRDEVKHAVKIVCSGKPTSVAGVIAVMTRIMKGRVPRVMSGSAIARLQPRDLRLRSIVWPHLDHLSYVPLPDGIARTLSALRSIHGQSASVDGGALERRSA